MGFCCGGGDHSGEWDIGVDGEIDGLVDRDMSIKGPIYQPDTFPKDPPQRRSLACMLSSLGWYNKLAVPTIFVPFSFSRDLIS